jgi:uncharacterized protein (DUF1499 family)
MKLGTLPLTVAVAAVALLLLSGFGVRLHIWSFRTGFALLGLGILGALLAAVGAIVALSVPRLRADSAASLVLAAVIGLAASYFPWRMLQQARKAPMIHDISTDLANPPVFDAILALRAAAPNPAAYGGPEVAAAQRRAYPDVQPLELAAPPAAVYDRALAAARDMGWELVKADPAAGRIEATATTRWFGFKDDVVVRITPAAGGGSRVDVRSVSRVGRSDVGTNAARIRAFLARLAASGS